MALTGSFLCKYAKHFKGERSLRRHICPVCNQVIQTSFAFVFIINHWIINQFIICNGWPSVIMFASWAWRHYDVTHVPNVNNYLSRLHKPKEWFLFPIQCAFSWLSVSLACHFWWTGEWLGVAAFWLAHMRSREKTLRQICKWGHVTRQKNRSIVFAALWLVRNTTYVLNFTHNDVLCATSDKNTNFNISKKCYVKPVFQILYAVEQFNSLFSRYFSLIQSN